MSFRHRPPRLAREGGGGASRTHLDRERHALGLRCLSARHHGATDVDRSIVAVEQAPRRPKHLPDAIHRPVLSLELLSLRVRDESDLRVDEVEELAFEVVGLVNDRRHLQHRRADEVRGTHRVRTEAVHLRRRSNCARDRPGRARARSCAGCRSSWPGRCPAAVRRASSSRPRRARRRALAHRAAACGRTRAS